MNNLDLEEYYVIFENLGLPYFSFEKTSPDYLFLKNGINHFKDEKLGIYEGNIPKVILRKISREYIELYKDYVYLDELKDFLKNIMIKCYILKNSFQIFMINNSCMLSAKKL